MDARCCLLQRIDEMNLARVTPIRKVARWPDIGLSGQAFISKRYFGGTIMTHTQYDKYFLPFENWRGKEPGVAHCFYDFYKVLFMKGAPGAVVGESGV